MFKRKEDIEQPGAQPVQQSDRITSVLGDGVMYHGKITGRGGVRVEGSFEGEVALNGLLVVGTTGRVTCDEVRAHTVIVAGALRGSIRAEKVEIRSTGRVWGDVAAVTFTTEEGAFLRGQIQMEEEIDLGLPEELPDEPGAEE